MEKKINTLKSLLPSSPFVVEQISYALKYAQEAEEAEFAKALDMAIYLASLASEFSNPDFYMYRPIVCALLSVVEDESKLDMFATETNSVLITLAELNELKAKMEAKTDDAVTFFAQKLKANSNDFALVGFAWFDSLIKNGEQVDVLKVAYLSMNLIVSKVELTGAVYEAYNDMLKALSKAQF